MPPLSWGGDGEPHKWKDSGLLLLGESRLGAGQRSYRQSPRGGVCVCICVCVCVCVCVCNLEALGCVCMCKI